MADGLHLVWQVQAALARHTNGKVHQPINQGLVHIHAVKVFYRTRLLTECDAYSNGECEVRFDLSQTLAQYHGIKI